MANGQWLVGDGGAAFGTATSEDFPAARGGHPGAESAEIAMLLFGRLVGFLSHKRGSPLL